MKMDAPRTTVFPIELNHEWRIVNDPAQWILQRRRRAPTIRGETHRADSFCYQRHALERLIRNKCGFVPLESTIAVASLPVFHPDSRTQRERARALA